MRAAEEIATEFHIVDDEHEEIFTLNEVIQFINEARKEAIEECAERAKLNQQHGWGTIQHPTPPEVSLKDKIENTHWGHGDSTYEIITVDKQSILNLIDELK